MKIQCSTARRCVSEPTVILPAQLDKRSQGSADQRTGVCCTACDQPSQTQTVAEDCHTGRGVGKRTHVCSSLDTTSAFPPPELN